MLPSDNLEDLIPVLQKVEPDTWYLQRISGHFSSVRVMERVSKVKIGDKDYWAILSHYDYDNGYKERGYDEPHRESEFKLGIYSGVKNVKSQRVLLEGLGLFKSFSETENQNGPIKDLYEGIKKGISIEKMQYEEKIYQESKEIQEEFENIKNMRRVLF